MIAYVVNGITGLTSYFDMLTQQKPVVTSTDIAYFPDFSIASLGSQIGLANQIASGIAYVLTWIGTAKLLYPHIKKVGQNQVLDYNGCCHGILSCLISSFRLGIFHSFWKYRCDDKYPYFFTWRNIFRCRIWSSIFVSGKNSAKRECFEKPYDIGCLWVSSLLYRRLSFCCTGSLTSIWTCFCVLYWIIMLSDIFGTLFFGSYSISRRLPAPLYKKVCNRAIEVAW